MIEYKKGNLLESEAEALVNTVKCGSYGEGDNRIHNLNKPILIILKSTKKRAKTIWLCRVKCLLLIQGLCLVLAISFTFPTKTSLERKVKD